ncbi:MAG: hypothetical protein IPO21_15455 [Bacteroidales bacterium]|nr:hypothetical protein [Bacteroidales bacterium]
MKYLNAGYNLLTEAIEQVQYKKMYRNISLLFLFIFVGNTAFAQKDLVISGGNKVSSFVCNNKVPYVWGNNKNGLLGLGSSKTDTMYNSPQEVTFFATNGLTVKQINSGSGSHFLALDCDKNPWAWGNNSLGQVGDGTTNTAQAGRVTATPRRVVADTEIDTAHRAIGTNFLKNVDVVYAGNNTSYAILDDGKLVAWGSNGKGFSGAGYDDSYGQLGIGDYTLKPIESAAKYVKTSNGQALTGVVQIFAGDNTAYALVDPDGDGIGTVYSWGDGKNGTLGRWGSNPPNTYGQGNPNNGTEQIDGFARPVYYNATTRIMDNITAISCGDVFGMALDVNGYVWTWGNGGWNNATGTTEDGSTITSSTPMRVRKGDTDPPSHDGTYLLAKSIGGGQGYGMAVTVDGKPVAWGGKGPTDGGGFGLDGSFLETEYIEYGTNLVHNDVILINRGDLWGFYGRSDGSFYAWGRNDNGQLGIGSNAFAGNAVKLTPPTGCGFRDPEPTVNLTLET